jgi:hypothetical protein
MKDYQGLDIYGTKNQFDDWYDETHSNQSDDAIDDELDIAFEDDEDEY